VIELKRESFHKAKKSSYENWEKKISQFCISMHRSLEHFYSRKALVCREIMRSCEEDRNPLLLQDECKPFHKSMEEAALASWVFPTLPGTNPTEQWPFSLPDLSARLRDLKPLTLWMEPFDDSYAFQEAGYQYLRRASANIRAHPEKASQMKDEMRLGLLSLLSIALNSGSYDRMVLGLLRSSCISSSICCATTVRNSTQSSLIAPRPSSSSWRQPSVTATPTLVSTTSDPTLSKAASN
jgi:hypothetical protein